MMDEREEFRRPKGLRNEYGSTSFALSQALLENKAF
jgi:hypothetical protein